VSALRVTVLIAEFSVPAGSRRTAPFVQLERTRPDPLLSRQLTLITITGSRTGCRYTFPVGYRKDGDRVLINVGWPERKRWWRNLRTAGRVEIRIQGTRRTGRALARGDEHTSVTVEVQLD
jgi:deazaflavin-dependent oxidoreductase (nitroreductase family)